MSASSDDTWSLTVGHPSCIVNFSHGLRGTPQAWCYMRVRVVSFLLCFFAWCARREFKVAYTRCFFGEPSRERHRRNQGGFVGGCVSASWNSKCPPPFLSSTLASYFFFIFVASFFLLFLFCSTDFLPTIRNFVLNIFWAPSWNFKAISTADDIRTHTHFKSTFLSLYLSLSLFLPRPLRLYRSPRGFCLVVPSRYSAALVESACRGPEFLWSSRSFLIYNLKS